MTLKLALGRAVHITGKLRKEPDTAVFMSANGLIRAPDFCKSGDNVAATHAGALQFPVVSLFKRIEPPMSPQTVPEIVFHTRARNDALGEPNPFEWKDVSTAELFARKNIVLFAVPGRSPPPARTPTCRVSSVTMTTFVPPGSMPSIACRSTMPS